MKVSYFFSVMWPSVKLLKLRPSTVHIAKHLAIESILGEFKRQKDYFNANVSNLVTSDMNLTQIAQGVFDSLSFEQRKHSSVEFKLTKLLELFNSVQTSSAVKAIRKVLKSLIQKGTKTAAYRDLLQKVQNKISHSALNTLNILIYSAQKSGKHHQATIAVEHFMKVLQNARKV